MIKSFDDIISRASSNGKVRVAIAQAADIEVLKSAALAREKGIAHSLLIGNKEEIISILKKINEKPEDYTIIEAEDHVDCAEKAVASVKSGEAHILMKGLLGTSTFLRPILNKEIGLLPNRSLISQISVFQWEKANKLIFITDCAINISPDLNEKKQILLNGLKLMKSLNIEKPKIAILAPVENVSSAMVDTIDAAALSKMGERGEFQDAIVDGPLSFDTAVSKEAVEAKGISSSVEGNADMILMPCLNTGNAIHKALVTMAGLSAAGVIMGAEAPIVSTSRSDSAETKLYSLALASSLVK